MGRQHFDCLFATINIAGQTPSAPRPGPEKAVFSEETSRMPESIYEPARSIPVLDEADVLVVGGGVAGCAAAYAAGTGGARTILVERNGCLGGVIDSEKLKIVLIEMLEEADVTVPIGCDNLLVGSAKSISTQPRAIIRGMSGCMICGQAAGVAGAVATRSGVKAADVPIRDLQKELLRQGVRLGDAARLAELGLE